MVKSNKVYTPQSFLESLTGNCYFLIGDDVVNEIHRVLRKNGVEDDECYLGDYPLSEIDHIVELGLNVVLVDCSGFNSDDEFVNEFRWFEVPEDFAEEEKYAD